MLGSSGDILEQAAFWVGYLTSTSTGDRMTSNRLSSINRALDELLMLD